MIRQLLERPLIRRLVYATGTAAALPALLFVWIAFFYVFAILAMLVMFMFGSGGTGSGGDAFMKNVVGPAFYFGGGAIAAGGAVALLNAIVEPRPFWRKTIALAALAGGVFAVVHPAPGPAMDALGKRVIAQFNDPGGRREAEEKRAIAFAKDHGKVTAVLGDKGLEGSISASRLQGGVALSYQVSLHGEKYGYAVVNVSRSSGRAEFSLVCVQLLGPNTPSGPYGCGL